jgi:electron transfer flavoprotein alpha/beta subunit
MTLTPRVRVVRVEPPPQRQKGVMVKTVAELVAALERKGVL